jgi:hypothetical protein
MISCTFHVFATFCGFHRAFWVQFYNKTAHLLQEQATYLLSSWDNYLLIMRESPGTRMVIIGIMYRLRFRIRSKYFHLNIFRTSPTTQGAVLLWHRTTRPFYCGTFQLLITTGYVMEKGDHCAFSCFFFGWFKRRNMTEVQWISVVRRANRSARILKSAASLCGTRFSSQSLCWILPVWLREQEKKAAQLVLGFILTDGQWACEYHFN